MKTVEMLKEINEPNKDHEKYNSAFISLAIAIGIIVASFYYFGIPYLSSYMSPQPVLGYSVQEFRILSEQLEEFYSLQAIRPSMFSRWKITNFVRKKIILDDGVRSILQNYTVFAESYFDKAFALKRNIRINTNMNIYIGYRICDDDKYLSTPIEDRGVKVFTTLRIFREYYLTYWGAFSLIGLGIVAISINLLILKRNHNRWS